MGANHIYARCQSATSHLSSLELISAHSRYEIKSILQQIKDSMVDELTSNDARLRKAERDRLSIFPLHCKAGTLVASAILFKYKL